MMRMLTDLNPLLWQQDAVSALISPIRFGPRSIASAFLGSRQFLNDARAGLDHSPASGGHLEVSDDW
jgi:hypothetical protein